MSECKRGGRKSAHKGKKKYKDFIRSMRAAHMVNTSDGRWRPSRDWNRTLCGKES